MGYADVSAADVLETLREFDRLGRPDFLSRYGYNEATRYYLVHGGRQYDSKAIVGAAHWVTHGRALLPDEFSGGEQTVVPLLRRLGFTVRSVRNPDWTHDEVVLACSLVADNGWHALTAEDPRVVGLSDLLQQLEIHAPELRAADFRNHNGVSRKTVDIATRHPDYTGKPTNGGRHDEAVLLEFMANPAEMAATAQAIRASAAEQQFHVTALSDLDLDSEGVDEGRVLERRHFARERDPKIRARKIAAVRRKTGGVGCEACGFDFARMYGARGVDFIECHHRVPLHVSGATTTRLADLVLLCSNCHRMVHRTKPWLTFEQLCELVSMRSRGSVAVPESGHAHR